MDIARIDVGFSGFNLVGYCERKREVIPQSDNVCTFSCFEYQTTQNCGHILFYNLSRQFISSMMI
jgi:hypothetical protein